MEHGASIYRSAEAEAIVLSRYEAMLDDWPIPFAEVEVPSRYGTVHVIVSGSEGGDAVLLFHAASMSSVSWAPNVAALTDAGYRTFAVDYIGEAGMSRLTDLDSYPRTPAEIAGLQIEVADALGIERGPVVGASAGGHAALRYALAEPDRVSNLSLLGPMGIRPLGVSAMLRMMMVSMFPTDRRVASTKTWALGSSPTVDDPYGAWFAAVLAAAASPPRVGRPRALRPEELQRLSMPVLLVLGDHDNLVGDPAKAAHRAASIPKLRVEVVTSAHLVNVERADRVNELLVEFLGDSRTKT